MADTVNRQSRKRKPDNIQTEISRRIRAEMAILLRHRNEYLKTENAA